MPELRASRLTLRWRMVLLATVVVTAILLVGGLVLVVGVRTVLTRNAVTAAELRGHDLASLAADDTLPEPIPIAGQDEALVQVVAGGRVIASSANIAGEAPLPGPTPAPGDVATLVVASLPIGDDEGFRLVSVGTTTRVGDGVVHVAVSLGEIQETVGAAARVGAIGLPVLVLALAGAMWLVVGRTLRPIDAIRREADEIGGDDLARRVPEPVAHDEVGRLAATVNRMLGRIEDSAVRQRRFVGDAAHELRSPIASLRVSLEAAVHARGQVDWDEVAPDLLDETLRMQRLTEQLLQLARLDATSLDAHLDSVDLDELVDQAATVLRRTRPACRIDLSAVVPVQIAGEPVLLGQVIHNLLDNATRHATSEIRVELRRDGDDAVLVVDDDGPGIPLDRRDDLFERFTRVDEARDRDHGGAGLGLAIVHDILVAHGGTVRVDDRPGTAGARFVVRIHRSA